MITIENDKATPIDQAKRFGLAETHSGSWRRTSTWARRPSGLYWSPAVTRSPNSMRKKIVVSWSGI